MYAIRSKHSVMTNEALSSLRMAACDPLVDSDYKQPIIVAYGIKDNMAFREGSFADYEPGVGTLRAAGGTYGGGGSESLVIQRRFEL